MQLRCVTKVFSQKGIQKDIVGIVVRDYITACGRENPFRDSTPGYNWCCGFLHRCPKLTQSISHAKEPRDWVHVQR